MKAVVFLLLVLKEAGSCNAFSNDDFSKDNFPKGGWGGPPSSDECETDTGSCGCCLMMQKVDKLKSNLTAKLDELENEYNTVSNTFTSMTTQRSAFSATMFENPKTSNAWGPIQTPEPLCTKKKFSDLRNDYNANTGIYTAPYKGIYSISVSVFHDAGQGSNEQSCVMVYRNGVMFAGSEEVHTVDHEDSTTVSVTVQLEKGDTVEVKLKAGCLLCMENDNYNVFSGFLLYAYE
ncbi:hypothetical protein WMY93_029013 [Mugilogobius chulae]|uniref:C1q domain-containing protein n=1 Tax=Mugilogobius chulae TaxID=88201 RepID=A0AAW0MU54_9GOBI